MFLLQLRTPAGVIDDDINNHPPAAQMRRVGQFAKLINARRAFVKNHQRRIHRHEIQRRVRTAKAPEPRERRRRGMHRQQMQNPAAEHIDDVRQALHQIAQLARRRNDGETELLDLLDLSFQFRILRAHANFASARTNAVNAQ